MVSTVLLLVTVQASYGCLSPCSPLALRDCHVDVLTVPSRRPLADEGKLADWLADQVPTAKKK